jgi:predicted glycoside hydrolase/deacetylase ChbG (UPF0249 family)
MVPCPWFYEMAQFCLQNPNLDYGIHLTLTGEWKTYPFRPVLPPHKVPTLVDKNGHLFPKRSQIRDHAATDEVRLELKAQIDFCIVLGSQTFTSGLAYVHPRGSPRLIGSLSRIRGNTTSFQCYLTKN